MAFRCVFWMWFSARMDTGLKMKILKSSYFWSWTYEESIKSEKDISIVNHDYDNSCLWCVAWIIFYGKKGKGEEEEVLWWTALFLYHIWQILVSAVLLLSCGDRQTDRITEADDRYRPTQATTVGTSNNCHLFLSAALLIIIIRQFIRRRNMSESLSDRDKC